MKLLTTALLLSALAATAPAVEIYNKLNQDFAGGFPCWDRENFMGHEFGQRITATDQASKITSVTARFESLTSTLPVQSVLVQVFNMNGSTIGSLVGEAVDSGSETYQGHNSRWDTDVFDIRADVSISGLLSGNDYLVAIQPYGPQIGYLTLALSDNDDVFWRNHTTYGFESEDQQWRSSSDHLWWNADLNMLVEGEPVPEPASLAILAGGLGILIRRRKAFSAKRISS